MKKLIKKSTIVLLLCALMGSNFISLYTLVNAAMSDAEYEMYEKDEDMYFNLCITTNLSAEDKKTCETFYSYLNEKNVRIQKELDEIKNNINATKKNLEKAKTEINKLSVKIRKKEAEINISTTNIKKLEVNIQLLEEQIAIREDDILKRDNAIKARLESVQSIMAVNAFADFVMGAKDFVDLIRRVEGVNDITEYDKQQIRELEEQRAKLLEDKASVVTQKESLEKTKAIQLKSKAILLEAQNAQQVLIAEYNTKAAQLEAEMQTSVQNLAETQKALSDLSSLSSYKGSPGFIYPLNNFKISAGAFYYPASFCSSGANKCAHLGTDFAAAVGTDIVAPANAVVMYMHDGCPTYGGLGTWCGTPGSAGAGNHVMLGMSVNGKTYVMKFGHMSKGVSNFTKWPAADNKMLYVSQGQKIGEIGSSGNSTGPHTHVEIVYFGTATIEAAIRQFSSQGKFDFGLGWGNAGLLTTCNKKNYKAPCRYSANELFKVEVGKSYGN